MAPARLLVSPQADPDEGDLLKYWKYEGTFLWTHWSELGIPNYEKIFQIGLKGIIQEAEERLKAIDREVPPDYVEQKEFLQAALIALHAAVKFIACPGPNIPGKSISSVSRKSPLRWA